MPSASARISTSPIQTVCALLALQRALVDDVAAAVRHGVVDEQPVLEVLAGVGEVQAEQLDVAAGRGEPRLGRQPDEVAAEGHDDALEPGVAADA